MNGASRIFSLTSIILLLFLAGCEKDYPVTEIEDVYGEFESVLSENRVSKGDYDVLQICHFSDIHGYGTNLKRIISFCEKYSRYIDCILHTGDSVADRFSDDFNYWGKAGASHVMNVIGNHDTAKRVVYNYDWTAHAGSQAYNKFIAPYVKLWDVVQPQDASAGLCYYYKDYSSQGIRMIMLDCMTFDERQQSWLEETLSEARVKDLAVICVSHYPAGVFDHSDKNSFDPVSMDVQTADPLNPGAAETVDKFIKDGGEFICWLCGHIHIDTIAPLRSYPEQLCVAVAEAKCDGRFGDQIRQMLKKSQDLFNMTAIDRDANTIKFLRVGADVDKQGNMRHIMCYNYEKMKVVYER